MSGKGKGSKGKVKADANRIDEYQVIEHLLFSMNRCNRIPSLIAC
jgi:hypothetical protein